MIGTAEGRFEAEEIFFQQIVRSPLRVPVRPADCGWRHAGLVQDDARRGGSRFISGSAARRWSGHGPASPSASARVMASGPSALIACVIQRQQGGAFHKVQHRQAGGEARRARCRQHMVGTGDVIAHRFGGVTAQEDGAGMANLGQQRFGIGGGDFQMFRREEIGQSRGVVQAFPPQ